MKKENEEKLEMEQKPEGTVEMEEKPVEQKMAEEPKEKEDEKEESPSEETENKPENDEKEEDTEKKEFSLDAYLDVAATLAFLEEETETFKEMKEEEYGELEMACKMAVEDMKEKKEFADAGKVFKAMFAKAKAFKMYAEMCKMKAEQFAQENEELKKFKAQIEEQQMKYQIDLTMKEVEPDMPKEEYEAALEDSKNFSLQNIDVWKNKVLAKAFTFAKNNPNRKDDVRIIGLPWNDDNKKKSQNGWDW